MSSGHVHIFDGCFSKTLHHNRRGLESNWLIPSEFLLRVTRITMGKKSYGVSQRLVFQGWVKARKRLKKIVWLGKLNLILSLCAKGINKLIHLFTNSNVMNISIRRVRKNKLKVDFPSNFREVSIFEKSQSMHGRSIQSY